MPKNGNDPSKAITHVLLIFLLHLNAYVLAGFSIHEELQEWVSAGIPEYEALKACTANAALFLKKQSEVGTIEAGKQADLVLLEGNPLQNIANTKNEVALC